MKGPIVDRIREAVDRSLPREERSLIAVSGGLDSMVLLDAAAAVRGPEQLIVATFDHGSGVHATRAADFVQRTAMSRMLAVVVGQREGAATGAGRPSEGAWREARLAFLRAASAEHRAVTCTAHTRDDQVETVLFREMRGAGPRGLAGLAAPGEMRRPLLSFGRADIADYAAAAGVEWIDDPTNVDLAYARNRLRHDLLPALRAAWPSIDCDLIAIGERAARWRADVEAMVDARIAFDADATHGVLEVSRDSLRGYADDALGILWPALLARIGVAADWRGTRRLVAFTTQGSTGQRIQLSGGWTVYRRRRGFEIRRESPSDRSRARAQD